MNIFQIMGCTSDQYASLEHYLVRKANYLKRKGNRLVIAYNNIPASKEFVNNFKKEGGVLYKLEAHSLLDFSFYLKFRKIILQHNIDVVHAYFAPTRHYAIFAAWLLGIKKRFRQAANLPLTHQSGKGFNYKLFLSRHRLLSLFVTKYICRSNAVKSEYIKMGINPQKLFIAEGGTDTDKYKKTKGISFDKLLINKTIIKQKVFIIGTASRLVKEKGIDVLIKSFKILKEKKLNIFCIILGDGPEKNNLQKLSDELDLNESIIFLGHKEDLENYYSIMDVYVSASFSEGMSNAILEAMSCELPVILSDITPNREIIETAQKENLYVGDLFKTGDTKDLSNKIMKMINIKNQQIIGKNSRALILNKYSLEKRIQKEMEIYTMI